MLRQRGSLSLLPSLALALGLSSLAPATLVAAEGGTGVRLRPRAYDAFVYATANPRSDAQVTQIWQEAEHVLAPHDPLLARHTLVVTPQTAARLQQAGVAVTIEPQNVQQLVDDSYARNDQVVAAPGDWGPWFTKIQQLEAIEAQLTELVGRAQGRAKIVSIGRSIQGRDIHAVLISSRPDDESRASIITTGTQHAREWMSPMVVMGVVAGLIDGYDKDPRVKSVVDNLNVWVVPVMNPDGYVRTFNGNRLQRKNMRVGCNIDINRNFATAFGQKVTNNCNTETTSGPMAFSEPESQALRQLAEKLKKLRWYVDYHQGANQVMIPYAYTRDEPPGYAKNRQWGSLLAMNAMLPAMPAFALAQGQGGGSLDWFRAVYTESLVVELPGRNFDPPPSGVAASVELQWKGWLSVAEIVARENSVDGVGGAAGDAGSTDATGDQDGGAAGSGGAGGGGGGGAGGGSTQTPVLDAAAGSPASGGATGGSRPAGGSSGAAGGAPGAGGSAGAGGIGGAALSGGDDPVAGGWGCHVGSGHPGGALPGLSVTALLVGLGAAMRRRRGHRA